MQIELSRKRIDPITGSEYKERKTFRLNASGNPTESIVFHQTADLLGIKTFDRLNPHVYRKLAVLYNWAVGETGSNDPEIVVSAINSYKSKLGISATGKELLDSIYRNVRLEEDRKTYEEKDIKRSEQLKEISKDFKKEGKRADEIKKDSAKHKETVEADKEESEKRIKETVEAWKSALPKDNTMKVKVLKVKEDRQEMPVGNDYI